MTILSITDKRIMSKQIYNLIENIISFHKDVRTIVFYYYNRLVNTLLID